MIVTEGAENGARVQAIRRRGGPGSGDRRRPAGRSTSGALRRAGEIVGAKRPAGSTAGAATQAAQQAMAFIALFW
jgi:hypothetical protein